MPSPRCHISKKCRRYSSWDCRECGRPVCSDHSALKNNNQGTCVRCIRDTRDQIVNAAARWQHNTKRGRQRRHDADEALATYRADKRMRESGEALRRLLEDPPTNQDRKDPT